MITLELTNTQAEDVLFATSMLYQDYVDVMGTDYNESIRRYNDKVDELRLSIKKQIKEQNEDIN